MLNVDIRVYVVALFIVMMAAIAAFILVIRSLQGSALPIVSIKLYNSYFILGCIGWLMLGIRDAGLYPMTSDTSLIFYVLCSFVLILAVGECARNRRVVTLVGALHGLALLAALQTHDESRKLLFLAGYSLLAYPFVAFVSLRRGRQRRNVGHGIIGFAALLVLVSIPLILYGLYGGGGISLAYGASVAASSSAFVLVGIGYLSSLLVDEHKALASLALKDPLTGLFNRRGLDSALVSVVGMARRNGGCICAIALDIDFFKKINDTYGHDGGDLVLQQVAALVSRQIRPSDIAARLGGEEFVILLPDGGLHGGLVLAERIRKSLEAMVIIHDKKEIRLTSSFGVAAHCKVVDVDALLKDADKALYAAKHQGRNRVCSSFC